MHPWVSDICDLPEIFEKPSLQVLPEDQHSEGLSRPDDIKQVTIFLTLIATLNEPRLSTAKIMHFTNYAKHLLEKNESSHDAIVSLLVQVKLLDNCGVFMDCVQYLYRQMYARMMGGVLTMHVFPMEFAEDLALLCRDNGCVFVCSMLLCNASTVAKSILTGCGEAFKKQDFISVQDWSVDVVDLLRVWLTNPSVALYIVECNESNKSNERCQNMQFGVYMDIEQALSLLNLATYLQIHTLEQTIQVSFLLNLTEKNVLKILEAKRVLPCFVEWGVKMWVFERCAQTHEDVFDELFWLSHSLLNLMFR